jgi:hypothetical protein
VLRAHGLGVVHARQVEAVVLHRVASAVIPANSRFPSSAADIDQVATFVDGMAAFKARWKQAPM